MKRLLTKLASVLFLLFILACSSKEDETPEPTNPVGAQKDIVEIDQLVSSFMTKHNVPGLQIALTRQGKLVYAKSYGKADNSEELKNNHLLRIASVSKPITGVAIMKLIQAGKLSLDSKAFGAGSILGTTYGNVNATVSSITVRHLLQHTSGGWGNSVNDPMFLQPNLTADQLITWTLTNRPLTSTPGTKYDYSNFGYCVLGRIIEKITGQTYEQYVQAEVLKPAGIQNMRIGGNKLEDRKPNEVMYYGSGNENPYLYNISRMDAHGGWIASATDLLRLQVAVDGYNTKPDILTALTITQMTTPSSANSNYANGWQVNTAGNWWHLGSLPGTASILVRSSNGFCWAILANTRTSASNYFSDLDELPWKIVNSQSIKWPDTDLF